MKRKFFTLTMIAILGTSLGAFAQLNTGTGTGWDNLSPAEPLQISENFQGFPFFDSNADPNSGNSQNLIDPVSSNVIYGYKDTTCNVPLVGTTDSVVTYTFKQCAFAPAWATAYAFRDDGNNSGTSNTANVSIGFVEISRDYPYGTPPYTIHGYFEVDLRKLDFVEGIQWSHSSTGGNKRGVMCEFSLDNGTTWDTLRYEPGGAAYASSFTKDPTTGAKTANGYRCDPSAYGMTWEDGIYASNVMLRFGECGGQTPRIHDLKVYGDYTPNAARTLSSNELKIYSDHKLIRISETAKVAVYSLTGALVKTVDNASQVSMAGMPTGIYLVKAQTGSQIKTSKVLIK